MKAAWYEKNGDAHDVFQIGELPVPDPKAGEVQINIHISAVNPSDTNRRRGSLGHPLTGLTVPHYDGAGVVTKVGAGVDESWLGQRVWTNIGGAYPQHGTAAQITCLPLENVAPLPETTSFEHGACLGVPAMTAYCCLFSDGSITGQSVLVTGGAGAVGHYAIQLAKWAGARVVTTVSSDEKAEIARKAGADLVVNYRNEDVAAAALDFTGGTGVDRIVDVDFGANLTMLLSAIRVGGVIATYASQADHAPAVPAYEAMRKSVTIKFVLLPMAAPELRRLAREGITRWLETGHARHLVAQVLPLDAVADAHVLVESGSKLGCALVRLPE